MTLIERAKEAQEHAGTGPLGRRAAEEWFAINRTDLARALIAADDLAQKAQHVCDVLEADNGHAPVALKEALAAYRAAISQEPDT